MLSRWPHFRRTLLSICLSFFFFQAEDGIRDRDVTGVQTCALPILIFAYIDQSVRNDFTYFYTVTAFDVNSLRSGPSSLESPKITKQVTPRHAPNTKIGRASCRERV